MSEDRFAAIEAGGTKIICAIAGADGAVLAQTRLATGLPDANFAAIADFFAAQVARYGPISAGAIASFGPLDLDRSSPHYGCLTTTPKPGWSSFDVLGRFGDIIGAPAGIDTDVNCAALAEARLGAARGLARSCYVTVGTGIGVGMIDRGRIYAGTSHAEAGHIRIARAPGDDFPGVCPSHGDCAEGLASGPAIQARWHISAENLPADHIGWDYQAHYLAALCVNLTYIMRPQRIIVGGGVMERSALLAAVRTAYLRLTAGYALDRFSKDADTYICAPQLRDPAPGLVGAIALARDIYGADTPRNDAASN